MKALIWIVTYIAGIIVYSILYALIAFFTKFRMGGIFHLIALALIAFIARSLCIKWDTAKSRKLKKTAIDQGIAPIEYIRNQVPRIVFDTCETHRGNKMELDKYLKHCIVINLITKRHYGILMKEYSKQAWEIE